MTQIDPTDPIVRLLGAAAAREATDPDGAAADYRRAWEAAASDYQACLAAHYVARIQEDAADRFEWNRVALRRAVAAGDERVAAFLPSLQLNLGHSCEELGRFAEARAAYSAAERALESLPAGAYRDAIAAALLRGRARIDAMPEDGGS